jgi:molybdopterin converting factor subunit 1
MARMNITICYFARFREKLACKEERYHLTEQVTVEQLLQQLATRGGVWFELFDCPQGVLVAINQEMTPLSASISAGDEVAFFPPVTGG